MANKILISGGSGLIGRSLTNYFKQNGKEVAWLTRKASTSSKIKQFEWSVTNNTIDEKAVPWCDAIIHLAGAGVADKRWSDQRKKIILDSRVNSTRLLANAIQKSSTKPEVFVSASAIGYYGADSGDKVLDEDSPVGNDFLAHVVQNWEHEVDKIADLGIRTVKNRIGIVLSKDGGALAPMIKTTKLGIGSPLGSGKQMMSWIHEKDIVEIFYNSVENEDMKGIYNLVAPNPVSNKEVAKSLASALSKPFFMPNVPSFVLRIIFGEMSTIILGGNVVHSKRLKEIPYKFHFSNISTALQDLV